jgi:hypothetical protein
MAMLTTVFPLLGAPSGSRELLFGSMPNPTGMPMCSPAMYMDAIRMAVKAEPYEMCPAESMYWKHDPAVYGGYEGCVGTNGLTPCAQNGHGGEESSMSLTGYNKPLMFDYATGECVPTGYTAETETLWILWGHPQDNHELAMRTGGETPVVNFPLVRAPYPSYEDDARDLAPKVKQWLDYLGFMSMDELTGYDVTTTEGAEQGIGIQIAAMAAHIAETTCHRDIYLLFQVPAYGYDLGAAAKLADEIGDYSVGCPEGTPSTVTIHQRGWLPGTPIPVEAGYPADSTDPNSPWMETLVWPENPTGELKTTIGPVSRRVCDACYIFPMFFGMQGWEVDPNGAMPECMSWASSITKVYSASVRAGFVLYKNDVPEFASLVAAASGKKRNMPDGLMSEWTWWGQIQIYDQMMAKPVDDPTSWIGAYITIQAEKWEAVVNAFAGCTDYVELTNPYAGAYAFFMLKGDAVGKEDSSTSTLFGSVFGITSTTYSWGFRGANPADYYGAGYGTTDFIRMQLFRDVNVYHEAARRVTLACADPTVGLPGFMSITEWIAMRTEYLAGRRKLQAGHSGPFDHAAAIRKAAPHLADHHVERLHNQLADAQLKDVLIKQHCAPAYTSDCLMTYMTEAPLAETHKKEALKLL